jgi:glycosyltransferase involved in cell wall biosynthesis
MAEALACGVPVMARRRGSVPEVIRHAITGLIGETDEELAAPAVGCTSFAATPAGGPRRYWG